MPEQPQWPERTLDMPPQDPWADPPTTDMPPRPGAQQPHQQTRVWGATPQQAPAPGSAPVPGGAPAPGTARLPGGAPAPGTARVPDGAPTAGTARVPGGASASEAVSPPAPSPFNSGRASVTPRARPQEHVSDHEPTGTGWPGSEAPRPQRPLGWHLEQLRRGGEWSFAGLLFDFVCWGIWTISTNTGDFTSPIITFVVALLVAVGVFALARLIGRIVWERQLGRERHTARGSHIVAGVFLVGVGIAHLQQTAWVMDAVNWVTNLFGA